jgi:hypothetical protein
MMRSALLERRPMFPHTQSLCVSSMQHRPACNHSRPWMAAAVAGVMTELDCCWCAGANERTTILRWQRPQQPEWPSSTRTARAATTLRWACTSALACSLQHCPKQQLGMSPHTGSWTIPAVTVLGPQADAAGQQHVRTSTSWTACACCKHTAHDQPCDCA